MEAKLHETMDAVIWAKEFKRIFPDSDESLMLGWFANAIMTGHDHAMRKAPKNELPSFNNEALAEIEDCIRHYVDDDIDVRKILFLISKFGSSGKRQLDVDEAFRSIKELIIWDHEIMKWVLRTDASPFMVAQAICKEFSTAEVSDLAEHLKATTSLLRQYKIDEKANGIIANAEKALKAELEGR